MKVVKRKISELIPAEYNPRKLSPKQENDLKNSLLEFGLVDPIIVNVNADRKNVIIGGHQRLKVWQKLGNKEIDCVEVDLSLEKERELNVRLNKNTGEFDFDILLSEFEFDDLIDWGFRNLPKKDDFKYEFYSYDNDNCVYPIVPQFSEKHELFIIVSDNEIDSNFLREKFKMQKMKSYKSDKISKSNVIHIKDILNEL